MVGNPDTGQDWESVRLQLCSRTGQDRRILADFPSESRQLAVGGQRWPQKAPQKVLVLDGFARHSEGQEQDERCHYDLILKFEYWVHQMA